jgi:two-component system, response regulator PdtaR
MHALVIEDELMIAAEIEFVLRECGFETVDIARSSEVAVQAAAANIPDLITADFDLRPQCGIETVRTICPQPTTPVIFITARQEGPATDAAKHCLAKAILGTDLDLYHNGCLGFIA